MSAKIKSPWAVDAAVVVVVCNSQTYALSFSLPLSLSTLPPFLIPLLGWLIVAASASSCRLLFVGLAKIMRIRCGFSAGQTARSPFILSLSLAFLLLLPLPLAPVQPLNLFICLPRCSVVVIVAFTFKQFHLQAATNFSFYYFRCQLLFGAPRQFFPYLSFPFAPSCSVALSPSFFLGGDHCREQ